MTRRPFWLLAVLVLVAVGALVIHQRQAPCGSLISYRLGAVDPRFGVTSDEVREALRQAESLWEGAIGRKLFTYDPAGPLVVSLVYDERQQATQRRAQLRQSMQETEAAHAAVNHSYDHWRTLYDRKAGDYKDAHAAFQ